MIGGKLNTVSAGKLSVPPVTEQHEEEVRILKNRRPQSEILHVRDKVRDRRGM